MREIQPLVVKMSLAKPDLGTYLAQINKQNMDFPFKTCLLIDDNSLDNFIHTKLMRVGNFAREIIAMESPQEALTSLRDGDIQPDVIFLDIRMPKMDGFQFLEEYAHLAVNKARTKIFMLSSSIDPEDIAKANANKYVSKYLIKSLTPAVLLDLAS